VKLVVEAAIREIPEAVVVIRESFTNAVRAMGRLVPLSDSAAVETASLDNHNALANHILKGSVAVIVVRQLRIEAAAESGLSASKPSGLHAVEEAGNVHIDIRR